MSYSKSFASALLAVAALGAGEADQAFVGTISDEICALSHSAMRMGPTDAECTRACIEEHGGAVHPGHRLARVPVDRSAGGQGGCGEKGEGGRDARRRDRHDHRDVDHGSVTTARRLGLDPPFPFPFAFSF